MIVLCYFRIVTSLNITFFCVGHVDPEKTEGRLWMTGEVQNHRCAACTSTRPSACTETACGVTHGVALARRGAWLRQDMQAGVSSLAQRMQIYAWAGISSMVLRQFVSAPQSTRTTVWAGRSTNITRTPIRSHRRTNTIYPYVHIDRSSVHLISSTSIDSFFFREFESFIQQKQSLDHQPGG